MAFNDTHEREHAKLYGLQRPRRWRQHIYHYGSPRKLRLVFIWTISIIVFLILLRIVQNSRDYVTKQLPTTFTALEDSERIWLPPQPIRHANGSHIDNRYIFMKYLGHGQEGTVSLYMDTTVGDVVAVKTWRYVKGVPRNPVPPEVAAYFPEYVAERYWQVEIEAGLHFGDWKYENVSSFVPVRDYFVLESESDSWDWTLVTPFIEDGDLESLAKRTQVHQRTPQKLDKTFRPTFEKLLHSLKMLHDAGFCHDDVKSDNVFVANATHWLLGDLGMVRHIDHPWHDTGRRKRSNQWSDCILNDVRRTLKTYMTFLRDAAGNQLDFDREFYATNQAWNQLYWAWTEQPVEVLSTLELSRRYNPSNEREWKSAWNERWSIRHQDCVQRKIYVELQPVSLHTGPWDYWPLRAC